MKRLICFFFSICVFAVFDPSLHPCGSGVAIDPALRRPDLIDSLRDQGSVPPQGVFLFFPFCCVRFVWICSVRVDRLTRINAGACSHSFLPFPEPAHVRTPQEQTFSFPHPTPAARVVFVLLWMFLILYASLRCKLAFYLFLTPSLMRRTPSHR